MDFEDGKRHPWLVSTAGGRRGGRPGGLFTVSRWPCGLCSAGPEAARPPRAQCPESACVGTRAPCRALPAPAAAGDLGVPCRPRGGEGRAQSATASGLGPRTRAPDLPGPRCVAIAPTPPNSPVSGRGAGGASRASSCVRPHRAATRLGRLVNPQPGCFLTDRVFRSR